MIKSMLSFTSLVVISTLGIVIQETAYGQITLPASSSYLTAGTDQDINWNVNGESPKTVILQYSTDGGSTWNCIGSCAVSTGTYHWVIPVGVDSWDCMVRIQKCVGINLKTFASTGLFTIKSLNPNSTIQEVFSHRLVTPSTNTKRSS